MLIVLLKNIKFATRKAAYAAARKMESEESRIRFFTMIKSYLNVSQVYDNVVAARVAKVFKEGAEKGRGNVICLVMKWPEIS